MRLKEIETRLAEIKEELNTRAAELTDEEITKLETEVTDLQEERRMFYVGMTRARHRLSISSVQEYNGKKSEISRFVAEAGRAETGEPRINKKAT